MRKHYLLFIFTYAILLFCGCASHNSIDQRIHAKFVAYSGASDNERFEIVRQLSSLGQESTPSVIRELTSTDKERILLALLLLRERNDIRSLVALVELADKNQAAPLDQQISAQARELVVLTINPDARFWLRSQAPPTDDETREKYNLYAAQIDRYYFYWRKNVSTGH